MQNRVQITEYSICNKGALQIKNTDLLIIDELSYLTFNRHQSELLFKVIADKAERRSVIVSINLKFSDWITMFENKTMVTAMRDRLTFRSHVLNMNCDRPYRAEYAKKNDAAGEMLKSVFSHYWSISRNNFMLIIPKVVNFFVDIHALPHLRF